MRKHLQLESALSWTLAALLAILAPIVYVAQPAGLPRGLALLLVAPFVVLALRRAERTNSWLGGDGSGTGAPDGDGS